MAHVDFLLRIPEILEELEVSIISELLQVTFKEVKGLVLLGIKVVSKRDNYIMLCNPYRLTILL